MSAPSLHRESTDSLIRTLAYIICICMCLYIMCVYVIHVYAVRWSCGGHDERQTEDRVLRGRGHENIH